MLAMHPSPSMTVRTPALETTYWAYRIPLNYR